MLVRFGRNLERRNSGAQDISFGKMAYPVGTVMALLEQERNFGAEAVIFRL